MGVLDVSDSIEEVEIDDFILGIIAGEGSFYITITKNSEYKLGVRANCAFRMNMSERDKHLLEVIKRKTVIGTLRKNKIQEQIVWDVSGAQDCNILSRLIDERVEEKQGEHIFVSTDKYSQFRKWKRALNIINRGKHTSKEGIEKMLEIRESMSTQVHKNRTGEGEIYKTIKEASI